MGSKRRAGFQRHAYAVGRKAGDAAVIEDDAVGFATRAGEDHGDLAAHRPLAQLRRAQVRRVYPGSLRVELQEHDAVAYWGPDTGSALVNSQGEVFEANVGDVEQEGLPRLQGPAGTSAEVLQMYGLLEPVFQPLGLDVEELELTGRGGWRATLDSEAVVELGGGTPQEVVQRTQRFVRTLTQVAAQYGRRVGALESADLRHAGGYALRLRGVTTVSADATGATAVRKR